MALYNQMEEDLVAFKATITTPVPVAFSIPTIAVAPVVTPTTVSIVVSIAPSGCRFS